MTAPQPLALRTKLAFGVGASAEAGIAIAFNAFNFLYYSGVLLLLSSLIIIVVSLNSPAPDAERISGLTFASLTADDKRQVRASWSRMDVIATCVVLGLVVVFYLYFSFWLVA